MRKKFPEPNFFAAATPRLFARDFYACLAMVPASWRLILLSIPVAQFRWAPLVGR
jgi:hypothetical protein